MTNLDAFTNGCQVVLSGISLTGCLIMWFGILVTFSYDDEQLPTDASWLDKVPLQCRFIAVGAAIWLLCGVASRML